MAVVALLDHRGTGRRGDEGALHRLIIGVEHGDAVSGQPHPIAFFQIGNAVGEGGQAKRVGTEEHLTVAAADHQRRATPGAVDDAGVVAEQYGKAEGTVQPLERCRHRRIRRGTAGQLQLQQVGDDFGIGVAAQSAPGG